MAGSSASNAMTKTKDFETSNSGSDSEDDDFVPEEAAQPSSSSAPAAKASKKPSKLAKEGSDSGSDDEGSDDEEAQGVTQAEEIDHDELEALKRERAELVAAAGGEDLLGKRRRLAQPSSTDTATRVTEEDEKATELKVKALAEWEAIKESETASQQPLASTSSSSPSTTSSLAPEEMVSIPTTYKFAGEIHTSTRLLPRSHPEAVKYLSQSKTSSDSAPAPSPLSAPATTPSDAAPSTTTTAANRRPPPGPRRKKGSSLAAMSAAVTARPTKLNTLEKSKLDWDSFKGDTSKLSQQELDELENQTKGGGKGLGDMKGFLERRDFLDRVKDRTGQS